MADLPSILGGMAQGFIDFGKGAVDLFGTGGAAIGDLVDTIKTGKVSTKNQDDFRKWLYNTNDVQDAAAKGLGTALNGVQTVTDYIPGIGAVTKNPLFNAGQGALGGLADEFKTYGKDYDLGRAGERAAVSAGAALASGSLGDALKKSANPLLSSGAVQGLARGATGGAISGGGYAAIDGGDIAQSALQGAGTGALIGGATGAIQDFMPRKATYDMALTDDEKAARIANAKNMLANEQNPERVAELNNQIKDLGGTLADADMAVNSPRYLTDENGNPRTFYHGTPKNPTESGDTLGSGLYITSNKDRATGYANGGDVSSYDTSGLNIANLDDVIPENVAKVLRDNPELSDKLKTLTPTTETYDLAQRDAAYNRFKALKGEYPRDLIEVKKTNSGFDISYPGDVDYTKITGKDLFRKLNTPDAQDVFMRAGYDGVSKTALGGDTEMAIYRNAPQPLESTLADADMAVNSAKIAPGQLGLFDDIPTQTPKTGTRQTSLFDQPDNPYLDYYSSDIDTMPLTPEAPANPYAPVDGQVTQAMRDRAADILGNWKKNGVPENKLYDAINPDTIPDKIKSLKEIVDGGAYDKRMKELFGTTDIKKADIGKVIDYLYDSEPSRAENIKNNLLAERGTGRYEQKFRNRMKKSLYEAAQERIANDVGARGLTTSKSLADTSIRKGYTAAADEALSERLGIAPGNTPKYNGAMDTRNAFGRYSHPSYREGGDLAVFERKMSSPEDAISTIAHERLHSFQGELEPRNNSRYDKEILDAYAQLRSDLNPYYKSWNETAARYGNRDTEYWHSMGEQESRMLQNYLENKGYTDSSHMKSKYRAGEWGNEINPAFDKFFDKLRDLSKRGVALPALAALFGGGAYMASQNNDKEKEVK